MQAARCGCILAAVTVGCIAAAAAPSVVKIEKTGPGYRIIRNGQPYFVKGAVADVHLEELKAAGGNSIRAGRESLDKAQALGLTVLFNLDVGKQRWGFNYADDAAVKKQLEATRAMVLRYKDHPAVLMWALGNELEIQTTAEQRTQLWKAVNDLARMIHQVDPNHPVITIIGGDYRRWNLLEELRRQAPALDAIGLNAYADMLTMPEDVAAQHWDKPYIVTEFGPVGHWQVAKTKWGIPIEQTSSQKAHFYLNAYQHAVENRPLCLGSYVFHWAQHHEKTHTWYGMFLEDGSRTEAVDVMTYVWTGKWPANRTPHIEGLGIHIADPDPLNMYRAGATLAVDVNAQDAEEDELQYKWELRKDVADNPNVGGDREEPTPPIAAAVTDAEDEGATIQLPDTPGKYRIFVYVYDGHGNAGTANVPILVGDDRS